MSEDIMEQTKIDVTQKNWKAVNDSLIILNKKNKELHERVTFLENKFTQLFSKVEQVDTENKKANSDLLIQINNVSNKLN